MNGMWKWVGLLAFAVFGCSANGGSAPMEGGTDADADVVVLTDTIVSDSAALDSLEATTDSVVAETAVADTPRPDTVVMDTGTVATDTGTVVPDVPRVDTGMAVTDTGFPDTGTVITDAGYGVHAGDLIRGTTVSTVYLMGSDLRLHEFTSDAVFNSWELPGTVPRTLMDLQMNTLLRDVPLGRHVTMRPGTWLVKQAGASTPSVYAVDSVCGNLRQVPNEVVASQLYGANWNNPDPLIGRVRDIDPGIFPVDYSVGTPIPLTGAQHPAMTLIRYGSWPVYLLVPNPSDPTHMVKRQFGSMAVLTANNYRTEYAVLTSQSYPDHPTLPFITAPEPTLIDPTCR